MVQRPLRIVHLFRAPVGGLFRHVTDLATEQAKAGHQVGLICDSLTGGAHEASILDRLRSRLALGLTRIAIPRQVSPADLAVSQRVFAQLRAKQPDVLHGHGAKGGLLARMPGARLGRRVVRIYTPHGGSLHYDPGSLNGLLYFAAERFLERFTDAIIHVSQFEAELYRTKVREPRCLARVIPNGLRDDEFQPVLPSSEARDLLFLGAFRDIKGVDVFLRAMSVLKQRGIPVSANLVGQADGRAAYAATAQELGLDAAFHDPMPAREAFATARIVVVPSRAESMPYVVLEAIAAGRPIVATRVGGIPEIFGPRAAELVAAGDADALAATIGRTLADPQRASADADARQNWLRPRFNIGEMHRRILALYEDCVERHSTASETVRQTG